MRLPLILLLTLFLARGFADEKENQNEGPVFSWANRIRPTEEQIQLLRLYIKRERSADPADKGKLNEEIKTLSKALGVAALHPATTTEPVIARIGETNVYAIHNPSDENVAFMINRQGDSGVMSWSSPNAFVLPPHATLIVTDLTTTFRGISGK